MRVPLILCLFFAGCSATSPAAAPRHPAVTIPQAQGVQASLAERPTNDGNEFLRICTSTPQGKSSGLLPYQWCIGYLTGILDANFIRDGDPNYIPYCSPNNLSVDQTRRIVIKYLQDRPEYLHLPSAVLIYVALGKAFPCTPQ